LRDGSDAFHVDGYHHTLFQVELPIWLPLDIVVKLMAKLEKILGNQIGGLMTRHKHANGQSGDGLSSDLSDGEDDSDDYNDYNEGEGLYSDSDWDSDSE